MKHQLLYLFFALFPSLLIAQVTIQNGNHVLEISGSTSTYANYRELKPTSNNRNKDRFRLRDAQLQLEGRIGNIWEYELQVDFVDLASSSTGVIDAENPGLMDAHVTYKGLKWFEVKAGYGKLDYSRSSLVPFIYTPYWQRAQIARGDLFSRRDVGLQLSKSFWKQRVYVSGGVYTGLGEISLRGDNDASGQPEFVGRAEFAYPTRYRHRDIDDRITPIPMFAIGLNARYTDKTQPEGRSLPEDAAGEFGWRVIDGKRYAYGLDFAFQYQGFSAQFEIHQLRAEPSRVTDPLFVGLSPQQTRGYVLAGGYLAQINYFYKDIKTIFSLRYEELDLNDLVPGRSQRFSPAIAYQINGYNAMIKFQYFNNLGTQESIDPLRWNEQFRLGIQLAFK